MRIYYGSEISDSVALFKLFKGASSFISFYEKRNFKPMLDLCQSFAVDNGAFSFWNSGKPRKEWSDFYQWVEECKRYHSFDFAVVPDVMDGSEPDNDYLLTEWPFSKDLAAAVWHVDESFDRLERLVSDWPRIAIGGSKSHTVNAKSWWDRMREAARILYDKDGYPVVKIHGLRMANPSIFTKLPLHSVDSSYIGRNIKFDSAWKNSPKVPKTLAIRTLIIKDRIESFQSPLACDFEKLYYTKPEDLPDVEDFE